MKKSILALFILASLAACQDDMAEAIEIQNSTSEPGNSNSQEEEVLIEEQEVFTIVEEMPSFQGGKEAWNAFVKNNLTYPKDALENKVQGKVYLSFIVSKSGKLDNIEIARGIGYGADEAAIQLLKNSPKWIAGKQRGREVHCKMMVVVDFDLESNT